MIYDMDSVLDFALDIGEEILRCGGEIRRAEDSLTRVCRAYGCERVDVFCITSVIILNVQAEGRSASQMRRIAGYGNNMARLEAVNDLCRRICAGPVQPEEVKRQLDGLRRKIALRPWRKWVGSMAAAGGFALFFGGNLSDGVSAALVSLLICAMDVFVYREDMNRLVYTLICSLLSGAFALALVKLGLGQNSGAIMIGVIMLLIPGVALTNSVRDMLGGDVIAGLLRLVESLLLAAAIAGGFAMAMLISGMLPV